MKNNSEDNISWDLIHPSILLLSSTAAITSTLIRILSFVAGKNLHASYQGPHSRSSAVTIEAKDMVSTKRDKMIQNLSHAGRRLFLLSPV